MTDTEKVEKDKWIANGMDELKMKISDLISEYEKKYSVRIHVGEFKYDLLNDKKDIMLIVFDRI